MRSFLPSGAKAATLAALDRSQAIIEPALFSPGWRI